MKTGKTGELAVKRFLMKHRYDVLGSNIRVYQGKQIGEIDILALKSDILYIVEVKARVQTDIITSPGQSDDDDKWQMNDIYSHKKHNKLHKIRKLMHAIRNGEEAYGKETSEFANVRFMMDPQHGLNVELDRNTLFGIRGIKIVLAQVTLISDNSCRIEFHPVNSGYY